MFSGSARDRHRLPRVNLGPGHVPLPDAAATGHVMQTILSASPVLSNTSQTGLSASLLRNRRRFVTAFQDRVMQIGNMRLARIERDEHALTLETDFYIFHAGEFSSAPVVTCAHTHRNLRFQSRARSIPGFRDRPVPEKTGRPDRGH